LGAHSLNQVFLGWAIGGYLVFIYYEVLEVLYGRGKYIQLILGLNG